KRVRPYLAACLTGGTHGGLVHRVGPGRPETPRGRSTGRYGTLGTGGARGGREPAGPCLGRFSRRSPVERPTPVVRSHGRPGTHRAFLVGAPTNTGIAARGTRRWHRTGGRGPRSHRTGGAVPTRSGVDRRAGHEPFGPEQFR